jgi:hypothetical protein
MPQAPSLRSVLSRSERTKGSRRRRKKSPLDVRRRLVLERLEDRTLPSTVSWTGAIDNNWDNAGNWSGTGSAPMAGDDVQITSGTVNLSHDFTAGSLYLSAGTLGGAGNLTVTGQFTWLNGTLSGPVGSTLAANGGIQIGTPGNVVPATVLNGRTLINNGTAVLASNTPLLLAGGAALDNGSPINTLATFQAQTSAAGAGATIDANDATGGVINNYGAFKAQAVLSGTHSLCERRVSLVFDRPSRSFFLDHQAS